MRSRECWDLFSSSNPFISLIDLIGSDLIDECIISCCFFYKFLTSFDPAEFYLLLTSCILSIFVNTEPDFNKFLYQSFV